MPYTEKTLYHWLNWTYGNPPKVHFQRIETMAGSGIPDVNGCAHGQELWLEGKVARYCRLYSHKSPAGIGSVDRTKHEDGLCFTVRRSQLAWMTKRRAAGGNCWFYIAIPKGLANRLWPLQAESKPAKILALGPEAILSNLREVLPVNTGSTIRKQIRLEALFGSQEVLKVNEWPLVEALLVKRDKT